MLYAKRFYIRNMLSKKLDSWSMALTHSMRPGVVWLHNNFNNTFMRRPVGDNDAEFNYRLEANPAEFIPTKYKVDKATRILREHAMKSAINGVSGQIDEKVTAIFYYTAFFLRQVNALCIAERISYSFTKVQRATVNKVLITTEQDMEKDHKTRMGVNAAILDTLIDTLADAHAERRLLKVAWENHVAENK